MAGAEPNVENKLFVGGCPPGSGEDELRKVFETYGVVEEVFIMRGGSRSGMACAFIRFQTQQMAQLAIDGIHGQFTLPDALEPLVVRWADPPGSRKRESRDRNRRGCSGSMSSAGSGPGMSCGSRPGLSSYMGQGGYGYAPIQMPIQMQIPMQAMGGFGPAFYGHPQMGGFGLSSVGDQSIASGYGGAHVGFMPPQQIQQMQQLQLMQYTQQPQAVGTFPPAAGPQPMMMSNSSGLPSMAMHQQLGYQQYGIGVLHHDQSEALSNPSRISPATPRVPPRGAPPQPPNGYDGPPRGFTSTS
mmetsp:Transcript_4891/g.8257  ORF Transcript_4891/g.8257 Transcript_4891/m.8257 type:complete len:300 (-) Transcript_4891:429-1328(-)|eukprot:CAMPEP_0119335342 /NCGR_PEP_ID=MMETSP1333-20130426/89379_1 /TAXON_ID=418940 /ORGANISM="Scyphosphaera apsteinii, Strain RCC1455" /LENGTH=299 /DNA_ID=CAMNT_0007345875 /DNA_START=89 /DNA_END=988 /DNA_ORIENTATION=+